jgi:TonB-dependent SusC/RagA subfamily outer membrane receptor
MITGSLTGIYPTMDILRTRSSSIYVLDAPQIDYPAALVEVGYLTNATDRAFITKPENQAAVARGILKALVGFRTVRGVEISSMRMDTVPKGEIKTGQVTMKIAGDGSGTEPVLVIVNGHKMEMKQLNGMTITADSAVFFKKNDGDAIKKFGAEGKNGVLIFNSAEVGKTPVDGKRIVMVESTYTDSVPSSPNKKQLIVIDGKSYGEHHPSELDALKALSPLDIVTINVLGGKDAEKLYGANGERGALVITTKQGSALELTKTPETMLIRVDTTPSGSQIREVTAIRYRKPAGGNSDPLVVIDGQRLGQLSGAKLDQIIDPTRIESINVLKGESAEKLFGAEGKNGVIMITSKAAAAASSSAGAPKPPTPPKAPQGASPVDPFGETGKIFTTVEQAAEFPGGAQVMKDFLRSRLSNDPEVKSNKKTYKGKTGIRFVVYQQGSLGAFAIDDKSGGNEKLAEKLIEYLKRGPQWEPARQNGKVVKVWHQVEFSY